MFGKKEKNKPSLFEEKHNLDGLYVAEMSIKKREGTVHSRETILCTCKKDSYGHPVYTDVLTKNKYRLLDDYYAETGENIVFNPRSFTSVLKNGEYKDAILKQGYLTRTQLINIYNALNDGIGYIISKQEEEKQIVLDSCTTLNNKDFKYPPSLHQEQELEQLMISLALNKKIALIIGNYGNGTTTLVESLAYLIKTKTCPEFLLEKNILEVNLPSLQRKSNKKNTIEDRIKTIIDNAKKTNSILFIDEADAITIPSDETDQNILAMLRYEAERNNLKIIITSTKKSYEEFKNSPEFKKQYDIITMHQLTEEELKDIITRSFSTHIQDDKIAIDKENIIPISNILLEVTTNNETIMKVPSENPGLIISIIDRSFAIAKTKKQVKLTSEHIKKALLETKELNPKKVEKAITSLELIDQKDTPKQLRK